MLFRSPWRLSVVACAAALVACGGGDGASPVVTPDGPNTPAPTVGTLAGQVYKGPTSGASVCVYALGASGKGERVTAQQGSSPTISEGCVVTGADGAYSFVLPTGTTGELLVESTGGTFCSDESTFNGTSCSGGGTPVAMGSAALQTVASAPASGVVNAPLTLLTTAAAKEPATLSAANFRSAYATVAANFNVPADPATSPAAGELSAALQKLATYVGPSTNDLSDIISGIATGALTTTNTDFPLGVELAVGADQKTMRLFTTKGGSVQLVSTASLPGIPGTYTRSGNTVRVTMAAHAIRDGMWVPLTFAAGTGGAATSGTYKVTVVDENTITINDTASGAITGGTLYRDPVTKLQGTYEQAAGNSFVTVRLPEHGLEDGDAVNLRFVGSSQPMLRSAVSTVVDANTIQIELPQETVAAASGDVELSVGINYSSFDTVLHPSGKWLYVASGYECSNGSPYCWGGDVITTFRVDWQRGKLTPLGAIRTGEGSSRAIPVKMAIDSTGTRLVHQDDSLDGLVLWNIDTATGALTRVADSGSNTTNLHGVTFSPDGQYVYNGVVPFALTATSITRNQDLSLPQGNGGDIVGDVLFFTRPANSNGGLYAYSVATPALPSMLAGRDDVAASRDLSTRNGRVIVTSGTGGIKAYTFANNTLAPATPATGSGELQRDGTATLGTVEPLMYRSVHLNQAGNLAVATYFAPPGNGTTRSGGVPSGYLFANVSADGQLTRLADSAIAQYARSAKFIKQPQ